MDMIGYRSRRRSRAHPFQVHVGCRRQDVEEASRPLADLVLQAHGCIRTNLEAPQIYPEVPGAEDRAMGRSDHTSFHDKGYPACLIGEDFFPGAGRGALAHGNPNYHTSRDRIVDPHYAADVARVVTGAVLLACSN
jgi:hypothetical protein